MTQQTELPFPEPLLSVKGAPVTCLGREFESDEARRAHFRDELRRLLPSLRGMEGFPEGTDDDIIRLSDPPYYTACPNPWLNDFIREWEGAKQELESKGTRSEDFHVQEPYVNDVSVSKQNPVYTAHPYHTKVPHPAIMRYILHYTQPGDIVFDGFAGTGMTGVAAAACANDTDVYAREILAEWLQNFGESPRWGARHAICCDLSPYASHIGGFYNMPVNRVRLKQEVKRIKQELEDECGWMYATTNSAGNPTGKINVVLWSDVLVCPNCGHEYVYWKHGIEMKNGRVTAKATYMCPRCSAAQSKKTAKTAVETYFDDVLGKAAQRVKQVPILVVGKCGKEKIQRAPTKYDLDLLKKIEDMKIDAWVPTSPLPDGLKTKDPMARKVYYAHQFFTKRTLIVLSKFYEKIDASPECFALRFMFTSLLNLVSKRNRVQAKNPYSRGQGVLALTLVLPPLPTEASLLQMIDMRLASILNAKDVQQGSRSNAVYVGSADALPIADNSVDYIFTDPPFGANINYSELNSMPEPWLRVMTNNRHEAIVNKYQGKDEVTYRKLMTDCFSEYYRILKPGRWMTVEFSNTSAAIWNSIQTALQSAGFVMANVAALDKKQGGMNANMNNVSVKQDLAISCYKPSEDVQRGIVSCSEANLWDFVDEHLNYLAVCLLHDGRLVGQPEREHRILYDRVVSYYVQHSLTVPVNSTAFLRGLRERYAEVDGMFFNALQAAQYAEKKKKARVFDPQISIVNNENVGILWLKNKLTLHPLTYQDIQPEWLKVVKGWRKDDKQPELMTLLRENFIEMEGGKWRVPNMQDDVDKEVLRTKSLLREFHYYAELAAKPRGKITEARVEALRAGFKDCYMRHDYKTIVAVAERLPETLREGDDLLAQMYDIASSKM